MANSDYRTIAQGLKTTRPRDGQISLAASDQWNATLGALVGLFSQTDRNFNADGFIHDAGYFVSNTGATE